MHVDVLILGTGAVGLTVASSLAGSTRSVALLDHGISNKRPTQSVGTSHHAGQASGRADGPGGTTQLWGGQLWAWEKYDFEPRHFVDAPPWPVSRSELLPHYSRYLELAGAPKAAKKDLLKSYEPWTGDGSMGLTYEKFSRWLPWFKRNMFRAARKRIESADNITLVNDARVRGITNSARRLTVEYIQDGARRSLTCGDIVVAAGTIGNILLLEDLELSNSPWLGRGFMDHVSATAAVYRVTNERLFSSKHGHRYAPGGLRSPRHVIDPRVAREQQLLDVYAHWDVELPESHPLQAARQLLRDAQAGKRGVGRSALEQAKPASVLALGLAAKYYAVDHRRIAPTGSTVRLQIDAEQPSRWDSLVRSNTGDGPGSAVVDWQIGSEEKRAFQVLKSSVLTTFDAAAAGLELIDADPPPRYRDSFHMMGGTRAAPSVDLGVVDEQFRLHDEPRVRVLGASTFPSGSAANPTMTAAAVALHASRDLLWT